jgi:hypothetical protein
MPRDPGSAFFAPVGRSLTTTSLAATSRPSYRNISYQNVSYRNIVRTSRRTEPMK